MRSNVPDDAELEELFKPIADRFASCPPPDAVRALEGDALPPALAASIRAHVERCPLCADLARDFASLPEVGLSGDEHDRIRQRVLNRMGRPMPARRVRPDWRWWAGGAAAAAMAASLVVAIVLPSEVALPPVREVARVLPPSLGRPSALQLDKPTVTLPLAVVLTLRGGGPRGLDVEHGLASYVAGDYRGAAEHLSRVVPNETMPQLALVLGVSYLYAGDPARAEATLTAARQSRLQGLGGLGDEIDWYLAVAQTRLGEQARAREGLDRLCAGHGARATQACAAVFELNR